jgi:hypothetical protein
MNKKLKKMMGIEILFFVNAGFYSFIGLQIWEKDSTANTLYLYFLITLLLRMIIVPIGSLFVIKNKSKLLMVFAFLSAFGLALVNIYNELMDPSLLFMITTNGLFLAMFTSFFQLSEKQFISIWGKEKDFEKFFYLTGRNNRIIDILIPVIIGFILYQTNYIVAMCVLITTSIIGVFLTYKLENIKTNFEMSQLKKLFTIRKIENKIDNKINKMHYLFIFLVSFVIQYFDIVLTNLRFEITTNELLLGALGASIVLLILLVYQLKKYVEINERNWFIITLCLTVTGIISIFIIENKVGMIVAVAIFTIALYIKSSSALVLSFRLMDKKDDFGKFETIFKREIIRNISKVIFSLIGFLISFDEIRGNEFLVLSILVIIVSIASIVLYSYLEKYLIIKN